MNKPGPQYPTLPIAAVVSAAAARLLGSPFGLALAALWSVLLVLRGPSAMDAASGRATREGRTFGAGRMQRLGRLVVATCVAAIWAFWSVIALAVGGIW